MWQAFKRTSIDVIQAWVRADGFGLSAALSFYAMFSLAPIMVFSLMLASHFLGEASAREGAQHWLEGFVSQDEATDLIGLVHIESWHGQTWWVTAVLLIMFVWAASLSFVRLRVSVNRLLNCKAPDMKQAVKNSLVGRVHALLFTLFSGLIMAAGIWLVTMAGSLAPILAERAGFVDWLTVRVLALLLITFAALLVIRMLPLRPPSWRGTLIGTGFLLIAFELGRIVLNLYLQHSWIASAYGAANTLVVFLLWIYYTAQALLLGVTMAGVIKPTAKV